MRLATAAAALLALAACGTVSIGAPPEEAATPPRRAPPAAPAPRAPAPAPTPTPPAPTPPPPAAADRVAEMTALVNRHRAAAGCPALVWNEGAAHAAAAHSDDMARRGYFSHTSPEGQTFAQRLAGQGVRLRMGAENIALDPGTPAEVLGGWVRSPGHRRNLEECEYTHHGIGERAGRWTHVFFTPAP
jgi:uncharacterized protein YkwD